MSFSYSYDPKTHRARVDNEHSGIVFYRTTMLWLVVVLMGGFLALAYWLEFSDHYLIPPLLCIGTFCIVVSVTGLAAFFHRSLMLHSDVMEWFGREALRKYL